MTGSTKQTNGKLVAIDLSATVLLSRYLRFWSRILPWLFAICLPGLILRRSISCAILIIASGLGYTSARYPTRWSVRCWTWLCIVADAVAYIWLLWQVVALLRHEFQLGLLVAFADICLFFWVYARVLREPVPMTAEESDPDKPQLFATQPSFVDKWLSGGWRTMFILTTGWWLIFGTGPWRLADYTPEVGLTCVFFALSMWSALAIPWALLPVARALQNDSSIALLRSVAKSRRLSRHGSYLWFTLRYAPKRPLSIVWFAGFVLMLLCALILAPAGLPASQESLDDPEFLSVISQPFRAGAAASLLGLGLFCWRRGRQHVLRGGLSLEGADRRPSTLYLRSFGDDQVSVLRDGLRYRLILTRAIFRKRFEEVIAEAVWPFGGLVGLARPGEKLPELGAVRVLAEGSTWQETIGRLMQEAQHILVTAGVTGGVKFEFQQIQLHADLAKLSVVIPPENASLVIRTWRNFASDLPPLASCTEEHVARLLAVRFREDGSPVFLLTNQRSVAAYRLALEACFLPLHDLLEATNLEAA